MSDTIFLGKVSIFYVKCNPARPSTRMDKNKPQWEAQIRTTDPAQAKNWTDNGLTVKFMIPEGKTPAEGFYRANLSKRAVKKSGEPSMPVEVVTGALKPLDPDVIGNGSTANIRLLRREYTDGMGKRKLACMLVGIQVTHLIPYVGGPHEGFGEAEYSEETPVDNGMTGKEASFTTTTSTVEVPTFTAPSGRSVEDF